MMPISTAGRGMAFTTRHSEIVQISHVLHRSLVIHTHKLLSWRILLDGNLLFSAVIALTTTIPTSHSMPYGKPLTKTSGLLASRTTKLQPRRVRHLGNLASEQATLISQNNLCDGFSPRPESSEHHLERADLVVPALLLQLVNDIGAELISRVIVFPLALPEAEVATRQGHDSVAIRLRHRDVRVVLVAVDVEVKWLNALTFLIFNAGREGIQTISS